VKRTIRSNNAPDSNPRPGPPGRGRRYGVRLKRSNDAAQLLTREKLRRVERHRERSKRNGREPRGGSESIPRERRAPQRAGRRKPDGPAFTAGQESRRTPDPPLPRQMEGTPAHRLGRPETWRTPGSAAGCNKPAKCQVEQTVEVGRNGKGGTSPGRGSPGPKVDLCQTAKSFGKTRNGSSSEQQDHREWTPGTQVDGGADL
jgi:hypothetical protein